MRGQLAGRPAVSDQQNLAEADDTTDPMDKEATEALPATQLEIDHRHFRLHEIHTRRLLGRQTKTAQYRVTMPRLPCERSSQDLLSQVERDVVRVHHLRSRSKCKKVFEYLVDELSTWITEDQPRISLSPTLLAGLKASSEALVLELPEILKQNSSSTHALEHAPAQRQVGFLQVDW
ncbi:hypothetical protein MKZ38_005583 [Zalerion maritima]|uniref:Uncharacterized protein n=1 Tax=Zalerion maritima TaxID=339359 RepID=A0AAD5RL54_9PEZI|nr:hypothetical protein MKZ38_005583 [Zalerion maritima]